MIDEYNGIEIQRPECIEKVIDIAKRITKNPVVLIRCIAYNQENYIRDTLDGFVKQKCDFSVIAIVHDDASTDSTPRIIEEYAKKYPNLIIPVNDPVNRHTERTLDYILDKMVDAFNPKYIAICEGDDYWTDENKLQKQVRYMDSNLDCVMCHGDYELTDGSKKRTPPHFDDEPYFGPGHLHTYHVSSLTTLYRYETYKKIPNNRNFHSWLMGDYPLWIELSKEGSFHYFPEVFGRYRIVPNSYSHSTDGERIKRFWNGTNEVTKFYSELYGYEYTERPLKSLYFEIQKQCFNNMDKDQARKYWKEAKNNNASDIKSFIYYFCNIHDLRWIVRLLYLVAH